MVYHRRDSGGGLHSQTSRVKGALAILGTGMQNKCGEAAIVTSIFGTPRLGPQCTRRAPVYNCLLGRCQPPLERSLCRAARSRISYSSLRIALIGV